MKTSQLKKLYPELWENIESNMLDDLKMGYYMSGADKSVHDIMPKSSKIAVIAHNLTFVAISEFHKFLKATQNKLNNG